MLGMFTNKTSKTTIFGHNHSNLTIEFGILKKSTEFDIGSHLEI